MPSYSICCWWLWVHVTGDENVPFHGCGISWFLFRLSVSILSVKLLRLINKEYCIFFVHIGLFVDILYAVIYRNYQELRLCFIDKVSKLCPNINFCQVKRILPFNKFDQDQQALNLQINFVVHKEKRIWEALRESRLFFSSWNITATHWIITTEEWGFLLSI